ncbi:putative cell wall-binding protein [Catenulispora sp. GP43]|uniref:cell wall-binding repeat-containing protein n=1 Tax=Catenulispora sp. GP43 TaxID=3156263 RepID=UPI003513841F
MRARSITATAVSTLAAAAGMAPIAAHAAAPVNLVVSTPDRGCSDTDASKPFCTVAAALASPLLVPDSSITVNGDHAENVTITESGISLAVGPWGGGNLTSVTVSGAQNVTLASFWSSFTIDGSSNVTLLGVHSSALNVTDSQNVAVNDNSQLTGSGTAGTIKDSTGTSVAQTLIDADQAGGSAPGTTVTGSGSTNTSFVGDLFNGAGSAVVLTGGSSATTIADDEVDTFTAPGVLVSGSTGNAVVGDTVRGMGQGVVATDGSTGLTIADDILFSEIDPPRKGFAGPMVVVDGTSTGGTSIHHNIVDQVQTDGYAAVLAQPSATSQVLGQNDLGGHVSAQGPAYAWGGTVYQSAADLQSHTGQGADDINADPQFSSLHGYGISATSPAVDSADSSAPGWQKTDYSGADRFLDPFIKPTPGMGPTPYADRGAVEFQGGPTVAATLTPVTRPSRSGNGGLDYGFQIDMSASKSPFAPVQSYGITDATSPVETSGGGASATGAIWYPGLSGLRSVVLTVTDADGHSAQVDVDVYVGPRTGAGSTPPPPPPSGGGPVVTPPSGIPGRATVRQIGGSDRYQTSRMVSQAQWADGRADAVVLARGDAAPDALTGVPLAAKVHGPLLLTDPAALAAADRAELDRVLGGPGSHKTVYILGGTSAVSPGIQAELQHAGYTVRRLSGADRYDTALAVANQFGPTSHVIVATGQDFPDALAAGPLGAVEDAPIVLSQGTALDPDTAAFVKAHADVDAVGMQAWTATKVLAGSGRAVARLTGMDRYQTAESVADQVAKVSGKGTPAGVGVAGGLTFPDALTGGAFAANAGLPLLLTPPTMLAPETAQLLGAWSLGLSSVTIFGGPSAVARPVANAITWAVGGTSDY